MSAIVRLGAVMVGLMLATTWPAALAQGRHGQDQGHGRGQQHGGQNYGGQHHGGQHYSGQYRGGDYRGGYYHGGAYYGGAPHWRGGHWHHGYHGGSLGWWWIVGPAWYYYPEPVYPYPGPLAAPVQYWFYCPSSPIYYPYTPACPDWQRVPVVPESRVLVPVPQVP